MPDIKDIRISKPTDLQASQAADWDIWEKGECEFDWQYTESEKCLIIEGEATVYNSDKTESVSFSAGDYVVFPNGLACKWKITKPIRKYYDFE